MSTVENQFLPKLATVVSEGNAVITTLEAENADLRAKVASFEGDQAKASDIPAQLFDKLASITDADGSPMVDPTVRADWEKLAGESHFHALDLASKLAVYLENSSPSTTTNKTASMGEPGASVESDATPVTDSLGRNVDPNGPQAIRY